MGQALAADSTTNAPPPARSFAAFKLITERNIFNPNRRVGTREGSRPVETAKPVKTEGLALVGTMIYEQGSYAFFDGSEAKYRTALQCSNTLAGLTLTEIGLNQVKLLTGSTTVELPIGRQLKRQDEGPWLLVAETAAWSAKSDSSTNDSTSGSSAGGSSDDILKRLMKKREQELNK
jgi:hypothetical protein